MTDHLEAARLKEQRAFNASGACCTAPDCCGPASYCCSHAGPHTHPEEEEDTQ